MMMPFKPVLQVGWGLLNAGTFNIAQFIQEYCLLCLEVDLVNGVLILLQSRTHFYSLVQIKQTVHLCVVNWLIPYLIPRFKI